MVASQIVLYPCSAHPFDRPGDDRHGFLITSSAAEARRTPASGPLLNSVENWTGPTGCDWGTRTEAGQKVPQAKPE